MAYFKGAASEAARAEQLLKRRQKEAEATADRKRKIKDGMRVGEIATKFSANIDSLDRLICNDSVGMLYSILRLILFNEDRIITIIDLI